MSRAREIPSFASSNPCYLEGSASDEDNEDLDESFCCMKCQNMPEINRMIDEPSKVIEDTLKDIKVAVNASAVNQVEDLGEYKSVEHDQIALLGIFNTKNLFLRAIAAHGNTSLHSLRCLF